VLNGAAARLVQPGDEVIIAAYAEFDPAEAELHQPIVVLLDRRNQPRLKRAAVGPKRRQSAG
jgi:aspartate 1-decarboxylase